MTLTFLGTGTSTGVPMIGCRCRTCTSKDAADHRLRSSVLIRKPGAPALLIDTGPDLRQQLLAAGSPEICAALITHIHYDHVGGIDDLRPYCYAAPGGLFPVYCQEDVARGLRHNFPYAFAADHYPGAPSFDVRVVEPGHPFTVGSGDSAYQVLPVPVMHNKLPILGYRIGPLAYITDASSIPESSIAMLAGVETLVVNALRPEPHPAHFSVSEALEVIARVRPERAYLTHASHDMPPAAGMETQLPPGVFLARDNATIEI